MTSGNPILDKNIELIGLYNPELKEKLLNLPCLTNNIELVETELKEPNLTLNGFPLHSQKGAEAEAERIFKESGDNPLKTHFLIGMGLGHIFQKFCEKAKGKIVLYEPNLEILRVTLELVDFSKELERANVKVASNFMELRICFYKAYEFKTQAEISVNNAYKALYLAEIPAIKNEIEEISKSLWSDYFHLKKKGFEHLKMLLDNLKDTLNGTPLSEVKIDTDCKTAIIVSAGPTLSKNIETIKKYRDKAAIFCVGTALKSLINNGITPDFVNVIEIFDTSGQLQGIDLSKIPMILQPSTNKSTYAIKTSQKFIYPPQAAHWGKYWAKITDIDVEIYESGGTVSYEALCAAKMLGFQKIILVGQDLAFIDNECYSKDSAYSNLIFEINPEINKIEYRAKDMDAYIKSFAPIDADLTDPKYKESALRQIEKYNKNTSFVKGIQGDMLPTNIGYSTFIPYFSNFGRVNPQLKLINTSMVGAQIDNFENVSLEEAIKDEPSFSNLKITSDFSYDKIKIAEKLERDKKLLENVIEKVSEARKFTYEFEKETNRRRIVTDTAMSSLKKSLITYRDLYNEYFTTSDLFKMISMNKSAEVQYSIRVFENDKSDEARKKSNLKLKEYFEEVEQNSIITIEKIEKCISEIKEKAAV